ncbi:Pectinesterase inhibitor domain [Macleaya cordata]|uniref:Pectinesterase inhibitor domain n=1 Tax=Macleaya cordata TaxID=56857 RepID=A0A200RD16_MACCD|nr:Pectinesterase inhibitor domain [Macleaya cordata]
MASQALFFLSSSISLLILSISFSQSYSSFSLSTVLAINYHDQNSLAFIQDTCRRTGYYDICVSSLESDPRSFNADSVGVARISIELAKANATGVLNYINNLISDTKNVSQSIKSCQELYQNAISELQTAIGFLDAANYLQTNVKISEAFGDTVNCNSEQIRRASSMRLEELPSALTQMNEMMIIHYKISLDILCSRFLKCPGSPYPPPSWS